MINYQDLNHFLADDKPIIAPLTNPTPIAQVHILLDTYSRPIPVIALFDTGAAATILHPKILPAECWLPHNQMFRAAANRCN